MKNCWPQTWLLAFVQVDDFRCSHVGCNKLLCKPGAHLLVPFACNQAGALDWLARTTASSIEAMTAAIASLSCSSHLHEGLTDAGMAYHNIDPLFVRPHYCYVDL